MPNWSKAINKKCKDQLGGETTTAGAFLHPAGTVAKTVGYSALGGLVGAGLGVSVGEQLAKRRRAENQEAGDAGIAADFPGENVVLGLTETRLVVFSHSTMMGKPKNLIADYPLDDIAAMDIHAAKALHKKVRLFFTDESAVDFDAPKASQVDDFCVALNASLQ
ncbi:MAG: hypothetical protein AAF531_13025 [Actinomycetota bacterium]